jgi:hypothetical protein
MIIDPPPSEKCEGDAFAVSGKIRFLYPISSHFLQSFTFIKDLAVSMKKRRAFALLAARTGSR